MSQESGPRSPAEKPWERIATQIAEETSRAGGGSELPVVPGTCAEGRLVLVPPVRATPPQYRCRWGPPGSRIPKAWPVSDRQLY